MAAEAACEPVSRWENAAMRLWLGQPSPPVCAGVSTRKVSRSIISVVHSFWLCSSFLCLFVVGIQVSFSYIYIDAHTSPFVTLLL